MKNEKETTQTTSTLKSTSTKNEALPLKLFGLIFVGEFIYIIWFTKFFFNEKWIYKSFNLMIELGKNILAEDL